MLLRLAVRNVVRRPVRSVLAATCMAIAAAALLCMLAVREGPSEASERLVAAMGDDFALRSAGAAGATAAQSLLPWVAAFAALAAFVGVATFAAASTIERSRALAMLRAMGGTAGAVRTLVAGEALLVAAAGALVGVAAGAALAPWLAGPDAGVTLQVLPLPAIVTVVAALALGLAAAALPAQRAARGDALTALVATHHEERAALAASREDANHGDAAPTLLADRLELGAAPGGPVCDARGLTLTHHDVRGAAPILRGVDVLLRRGECVALCGPSGAAKTTLLAILGGLAGADSGVVRRHGLETTTPTQAQLDAWRARNVGWVSQVDPLPLYFPPRELLELGAEMAVRAGAVRTTFRHPEALLGALAPAALTRRDPRALSGGERRRVALARALVHRPSIVLADEPAAGLDAAAGLEIVRALRRQARAGAGVLFTTHSGAQAALADRVLVLDGGVVTERARAEAAA